MYYCYATHLFTLGSFDHKPWQFEWFISALICRADYSYHLVLYLSWFPSLSFLSLFPLLYLSPLLSSLHSPPSLFHLFSPLFSLHSLPPSPPPFHLFSPLFSLHSLPPPTFPSFPRSSSFPLPFLLSTSPGGAPPYPSQWFCEQADCDAHQWQPALPGGVRLHWHGPSVPHWHCQPSLQPDKEPLQQYSALWPLPCEAQFHPRPTRLRLHQCQLLFCEWNTNEYIDSFHGFTSRGQGLGPVFGTTMKIHCTATSCTVQLSLDVCNSFSSGSRICKLTNGNLGLVVLFCFHVTWSWQSPVLADLCVLDTMYREMSDCSRTVNLWVYCVISWSLFLQHECTVYVVGIPISKWFLYFCLQGYMKQKAYIATQGTEPTLWVNNPRKLNGISSGYRCWYQADPFPPCPLPRTNPRDSVGLLADGVGGELENHCHAYQHTRAGKGRIHGLLDQKDDVWLHSL